MSKSIARRFIQEIFNEGKIDEAKKLVTPDIIYHGVFGQVRDLLLRQQHSLVLLRNVLPKYHKVRAGFVCKDTISSNVI